ncbi:TonB-dependent receptor [Psychrobium sp. 1_MG-2023]|uniref:TonB-dependent receptor n=1 Tax=Psychrobium sp. 1_MG-2023 TaxID=3062624 RepID=UPI000C334844|nr:TonB-dependent receptor [Psychrobium sp. 1_MG-2023]MDP2562821.1 TonB-dependent receptor [Psychrobium sp. 1_MG-2023]PKF57958.1 hypothetical protein CW748_05415 [Alteromonadales bacterium alter-6D02]
MKKVTYIITSLALSLLFYKPVYGQEIDSLLDFSLEDLLNVKVSVASTSQEMVIETPAIVSRYNRVDLEKMGVTTLREMFNFIPGVIVQTSLTGWASVQIRGVDEAFNQKVLFLLDGVPYHQPSHSLIPMEGVPWESISHVEVIRGPGAVFYGSQASGGVFNVITRKDEESSSASLKIGSNALYEGSAYYHKTLSSKSAISFAAEYRTEDGEKTTYNEYFPDIGVVSDDVERYLKRQSGLLRFNNDDFIVQLHAFSDTTVGINDGYTDKNTLQPLTLDTTGQLIHVQNSWETERSRSTVFADYNHYTFDLQLSNLFAPGVHALAAKDGNGRADYRFRYGGTVAYNVNDSLDLVLGAEHETRSNDFYRIYALADRKSPLVTLLPKGKVNEFSAYAQVDYRYQDWRFLLGGRFTDNEKSGQKTTPRAGVVYKVDEHQSLKALYSTGFNSPNPTQTNISLPGDVVGNEQLTAEVVETFDLAYSYSKSNLLFVANVYSLTANDFIQRRFSAEHNANSFFNEGEFTRTGAEIDVQMANPDNVFFVNLAYQREGNKVHVDDRAAINTPKLTVSVGASQDIWDNHSIGTDVSYIGARHDLDGYSVVNVNYTAKFSDIDLFVVVRNIFDQAILNPNISTQDSPLVAQGEEGVNAQLGVRFRF